MGLINKIRARYHRWRIRRELNTHEPDKHPGLKPFSDRELLHIKGVRFRVTARYTDPAPCLILEPISSTPNKMIGRLKDLRREDRIEKKQYAELQRRLNRRWQEARHVG